MRFSAVAVALIPVVAAETFNVLVGQSGGLTYSPESIVAKAGDVVNFQFVSKNHTVTQSSFAKPCEPLTTPAAGIDSGFLFVPPNSTTFPQYSITIEDDKTPFWFYCAQAPHCSKGMVFAINTTPEKTFDAFKATAMGTTANTTTVGATPSGSSTPNGNGASILSGNSATILATLGLVAGLVL